MAMRARLQTCIELIHWTYFTVLLKLYRGGRYEVGLEYWQTENWKLNLNAFKLGKHWCYIECSNEQTKASE